MRCLIWCFLKTSSCDNILQRMWSEMFSKNTFLIHLQEEGNIFLLRPNVGLKESDGCQLVYCPTQLILHLYLSVMTWQISNIMKNTAGKSASDVRKLNSTIYTALYSIFSSFVKSFCLILLKPQIMQHTILDHFSFPEINEAFELWKENVLV